MLIFNDYELVEITKFNRLRGGLFFQVRQWQFYFGNEPWIIQLLCQPENRVQAICILYYKRFYLKLQEFFKSNPCFLPIVANF